MRQGHRRLHRRLSAACAALLWLLLAGAAPALEDSPAAAAAGTVIRVGVLAGFPPYQVWPQGGRPGGADLDLLREIAADAGLALEPVRYVDFSELEADLVAGRIDVAGAMARTREREQRMLFSRPYAQFPVALVTRADAPSGTLGPDLAGRRIAVVRDFASEKQVERLFPLATRVVVRSVHEGLLAVAGGSADTLLEALPVVSELMAADGFAGLVVARRIEGPSGRLHLAVPVSRPELAALLSAGIEAIAPARIDAFVQRWSLRLPAAAPAAFVLDDDDRARLAGWTSPRIGVVGRDPPFTLAGAGGAPAGLAVDMLRATLALLGVTAADIRFLEPAEVDDAIAAGSADLLLGLDEAAGLNLALRFVGPYLEYPMVLIGRPEGGAFDIEQLHGRRLALPAGSAARSLVESRHPRVEVVECRDAPDCLVRLGRGEADAMLVDVITAAVMLSRRPHPDLQIIGAEPGLRRFHALAVHARHAAVVPLMRRALDAAVAAELPALKQHWLARAPREEVVRSELRRWAPWVLAAALALLLLWAWHSRRLHGEVARTRSARLQAERAESASRRFNAFLAHEMRNSLHSVIAGTELLRRTPQPRVVAALHGAAQSTLRLLDNLLDRERLDAGRLQLRTAPQALAPLVDAVVQEMAPAAAQRGLSLHAVQPTVAVELQIDALRVQQVLRNLVANAIKYGDRGRIEVATTLVPLGAMRWRIAIAVADEGRGIAAAERERLFEPYAGGDGSPSSSGLGLPLSRDLARLMGGDLTIDSSPGLGTVATLVFEAEACAPAAPAPSAPASARALAVLVVDDSEVYAMLLEHALLQRGHTVRRAGGIADARTLLRQSRFDLVLGELVLGDGDLNQLCDALRAGGSVLVAMSADPDETGTRVPAPSVALAVLAKTGDPRRLVDRLLETLAAHDAASRPPVAI